MADRYINTRRFIAPIATTTGKVQWLGFAILVTIVLLAVLAPVISAYGPSEEVCAPFERPSFEHILGCDDAGHDLFSQLLHGGRLSLSVGLSVAVLATFTAVTLAIVAGFYGGWTDRIIMRVVDVALSLPFLPLVIVLGVVLGASPATQVVVIASVMWAHPVRELRSQILAIRTLGFVEASLAMGASGRFVGIRHILPEVAPLIVPQFVRIAHNAILVETSLSFLGLGDPLQTSWGTILHHANARTAFLTGAWVYWIVPAGLAVSITVMSLAFIGFGYDASLSPRIRRLKRAKRAQVATPDQDAVLSIRNLDVSFHSEIGETRAVRGADLDVHRGELLGLVGESGSGKTTLALAVLRLLRPSATVNEGGIWLEGDELLGQDDRAIRNLRGRKIALVPQSAMNALNPVLSIGTQLGESLERGGKLSKATRKQSVAVWLERVGLDARHAQSYAHELSGGMRQRAVIAIALCNSPDMVIADEPTTGLDVLVQEEIMALLLELRQGMNLSILFVTHNLPLIARHADRLAVMYNGEIVDRGTPSQLRATPGHAHTRALFDSLPEIDSPKRWPVGEIGSQETPVLALQGVSKAFSSGGGLRIGSRHVHQALQDVTLELHPGEKLGLVGGSGAGKSTIARLIMGAIQPDEGRVQFNGHTIGNREEQKALARAVHMVFQDPYGSMRNSMSVLDVVSEPLRIQDGRRAENVEARVRSALDAVQLPSDGAFLSRLPVAMSGGQRQRVAFARAIITNPGAIVADEPTSMLDQSVRMEIMELMEDLRLGFGTAFLFITHDIVLARHFCDRIMVLKEGEVVEEGPAETVIHEPKHSYTRALIRAT